MRCFMKNIIVFVAPKSKIMPAGLPYPKMLRQTAALIRNVV